VALGEDAKTGLSSGQLRSWLGPTLYSRSRALSLARGVEPGEPNTEDAFHDPARIQHYVGKHARTSGQSKHGRDGRVMSCLVDE
jgi:hypothetical protein